MYIGIHIRNLYFYATLMKLEFLQTFSKIFKYQISGKSVLLKQSSSIRTAEWTYGRKDGQT